MLNYNWKVRDDKFSFVWNYEQNGSIQTNTHYSHRFRTSCRLKFWRSIIEEGIKSWKSKRKRSSWGPQMFSQNHPEASFWLKNWLKKKKRKQWTLTKINYDVHVSLFLTVPNLILVKIRVRWKIAEKSTYVDVNRKRFHLEGFRS